MDSWQLRPRDWNANLTLLAFFADAASGLGKGASVFKAVVLQNAHGHNVVQASRKGCDADEPYGVAIVVPSKWSRRSCSCPPRPALGVATEELEGGSPPTALEELFDAMDRPARYIDHLALQAVAALKKVVIVVFQKQKENGWTRIAVMRPSQPGRCPIVPLVVSGRRYLALIRDAAKGPYPIAWMDAFGLALACNPKPLSHHKSTLIRLSLEVLVWELNPSMTPTSWHADCT